MIDVYRNLHTRNYDVDISAGEWRDILCLPEIRNNADMLWALEKWYLAPDYTASCKSMGEQYGRDFRYFSVQNRRLGQLVVKYLKRFKLIGGDGKETYWAVAWLELKREKGIYIVRLRPELVDAIKDLGLYAQDTGYALNQRLQEYNLKYEKRFEYLHERHEKPLSSEQIMKSYPRDPVAAKRALCHAEFACEYNTAHDSFPRMIDGRPYMETHHLIPLQYADNFKVSIDVPENIVCLCSTCHNRIHYGQDKQKMVEKLWSLRKNDLHEVGISLELPDILHIYKIKDY
jgi:predicted HNH restriction endonuclease